MVRAPPHARTGGALREIPSHLVNQTPLIFPQRPVSRTPGDTLATAVDYLQPLAASRHVRQAADMLRSSIDSRN